jgi:4'-phosphopantetheinyl transferase EntD
MFHANEVIGAIAHRSRRARAVAGRLEGTLRDIFWTCAIVCGLGVASSRRQERRGAPECMVIAEMTHIDPGHELL